MQIYSKNERVVLTRGPRGGRVGVPLEFISDLCSHNALSFLRMENNLIDEHPRVIPYLPTTVLAMCASIDRVVFLTQKWQILVQFWEQNVRASVQSFIQYIRPG